jgi:hypothetical protein
VRAAHAHIALVEWARKLLVDVEATNWTVHWVCVKGHSADGGNDRAHELVQWGKTGGLYCRGREVAKARTATTLLRRWRWRRWRRETRQWGQIYGLVPARWSFEAANAALNVFNFSFYGSERVCVC